MCSYAGRGRQEQTFCYNLAVVEIRSCSYDGIGKGTDPSATIQMLGTDLFPTIAELDRDSFATIQMLLGIDLFPTVAEADKTNPFAKIQM